MLSRLLFTSRRSALPLVMYRASAPPVLSVMKPSIPFYDVNFYSGGGAISRTDVETRVLEVMRGFAKVDSTKLTLEAQFTSDLGLDSLDAVEVVMAFEEEFGIEIPDKVADEIRSPADAAQYIAETLHAEDGESHASAAH